MARRLSRSRAVLAGAVSLAVAAAIGAPPAPAHATDATHVLSGYAADAYGEPVDVDVYRVEDGGAVDLVATGDYSSYYAFTVSDGTYLLHAADFRDPTDYEPEWYQDAPSASTARRIVVAGSDVRADDLVVDRKRTVSGRVVDADGRPVLDAYVEADRAVADSHGDPVFLDGTGTDASGRFVLTTGRGIIRVHVAADPFPGGYAATWFPGAHGFDDAEPVTVQDDVDLGDVVVTHGALISGTVTTPDGQPVRHVVASDQTGYPVGLGRVKAETRADGTFSLTALSPGTHHLVFSDPFGNDFATAEEDVTVTADQQLTGLAITLAPTTQDQSGTDVSGRLLDADGQGLSGLRVLAYDAATIDPTEDGPIDEAIADATGTFHLRQLDAAHGHPPGSTYRLYFYEASFGEPDSSGDGVYAADDDFDARPTWFPDATSYDSATALVVPSAPMTLPDTTVPRAGGITGTLLNEDATSPGSGDGVTSVVQAVDDAGRVVASADARRNGVYRLRDLPAGRYRVEFADTYFLHANRPLWWRRGVDFASATPVVVTAGAATTGIDGRFRRVARPISGRVVDEDGRPVSGVYPTAYVLENPYGPGEEPGPDSTTDADGRFTIWADPGTYEIQTVSKYTNPEFRTQYFPAGEDPRFGARVRVLASTDSIDLGTIQISRYPTISGHILDPEGAPFGPAYAIAVDSNGQPTPFMDRDLPVGGGSYRVILPRAGTYHLYFQDSLERYDLVYYGGTATAAGSTTVTVGDETQLTGIDQRMGVSPPTGSPPANPPGATAVATAPTAPLASATVARAWYLDPRRRRIVVLARVSVAGSPAPSGTVTVTEAGHVRGRAALRHGRARFVLHPRHPRRHRYVVTYVGPSDVSGSRVTALLRAPHRPTAR